MTEPVFSVVISSYNRAEIVSRCIRSVLASDFDDYEIVVVDDGSSDGTMETLAQTFDDPRLRVHSLGSNRGMSEARRVGTEKAAGQWLVILDSDWELMPESLTRMKATVDAGPEGVRVYFFRMLWDNVRVVPESVPAGVTDYEGKLAWWMTQEAGDCVRCVRREVFQDTPYHADRRGAMDTLYELDLAKHEPAVYSEEVLSIQHEDAPNSWLRTADPKALIPRLQRDAPDMLWMSETTLERHGAALASHAPALLQVLVRTAAVQSFILGQRRRGLHHARHALRAAPTDVSLYAMVVAGLAGPWLTLRAIVFDRQRSARQRARPAQDG